jgi:hypothetical protein
VDNTWNKQSQAKQTSWRELCFIFHILAELREATFNFFMSVRPSVRVLACLSVRPHGTNRILRDRLSLHLVLGDFSKIFWEGTSFIKISEE